MSELNNGLNPMTMGTIEKGGEGGKPILFYLCFFFFLGTEKKTFFD